MLKERVAVIYKREHQAARHLACRIGSWLAERGFCQIIMESGEAVPADCCLLVVLGGDGTIIGTARRLGEEHPPILGINFGTVGFLAPFEPKAWEQALADALSGALVRNDALTLNWRVSDEKRAIFSGNAINDVVVGRGNLARLINVSVTINGESLADIRSDGVIFCSPLGSPGYAFSAGGSVISPDLDCIGFVPVCPYDSCPSPLVLRGDSVLEARIMAANGECYLTIDGQEGMRLAEGSTITVSGKRKGISLLSRGEQFFAKLKKRDCGIRLRSNSCQNTKQ